MNDVIQVVMYCFVLCAAWVFHGWARNRIGALGARLAELEAELARLSKVALVKPEGGWKTLTSEGEWESRWPITGPVKPEGDWRGASGNAPTYSPEFQAILAKAKTATAEESEQLLHEITYSIPLSRGVTVPVVGALESISNLQSQIEADRKLNQKQFRSLTTKLSNHIRSHHL